MADTLYAWSPIQINGENGLETIKIGSAVSQSDLNVDDAEWKYLQEAGVLREARYPKGVPATSTPREHMLGEFKKKMEEAQAEIMNVSGVSGILSPTPATEIVLPGSSANTGAPAGSVLTAPDGTDGTGEKKEEGSNTP